MFGLQHNADTNFRCLCVCVVCKKESCVCNSAKVLGQSHQCFILLMNGVGCGVGVDAAGESGFMVVVVVTFSN